MTIGMQLLAALGIWVGAFFGHVMNTCKHTCARFLQMNYERVKLTITKGMHWVKF